MSTKVKALKKFVEQELETKLPVKILPDQSIIYKKFRIKKNKQNKWNLRYLSNNDIIDSFNTKSSALLAAKFYDGYHFSKFVEIKELDRKWHANLVDIDIFKHKISSTKDFDKKSIFETRLDLSQRRYNLYKEEIAIRLKTEF